jgi:Zn-dependent peptidase ImmA (M78 family)/transcriptional regulator with XRE-family HTH domain
MQLKAFNPDMLTVARQTRFLSQSELARNVGIAQPRLSRIENGMLTPTEEETRALARALRYGPEFFFHSVRRRPSPSTYHRKRQKLSKTDWVRIYARSDVFRTLLATMLRSVELNPKRECPPFVDPITYDGDVGAIARAVRQFWTMPRGPVEDMCKLIEGAGMVIIAFDFGTDLCDGFSQHQNDDFPHLIFVNSRQSKDRLRFSLAHELGHIVMHRMPHPEMENEANCFAAEFLMPEDDIKGMLYELSWEKFFSLKMHWKTSAQALVKRAYDLKRLSERNYRYFFYEMSRSGSRKQEPVQLSPEIEKPRVFNQLVRAHTDSLGYVLTELSRLFGLEEAELEQEYLGTARPKIRLVV